MNNEIKIFLNFLISSFPNFIINVVARDVRNIFGTFNKYYKNIDRENKDESHQITFTFFASTTKTTIYIP